MSFDFINPWMLAGLAGVALPVLAHLLSRRRYDVVSWGAMQFLELGRQTRRRVRLEEFLLMLLRMGLIALLAIALARPWFRGGWLSALIAKSNRDVVIIIDGSYSMGWNADGETPHDLARRAAHELLDRLRSGDTVTLLDARDECDVVVGPTRDIAQVRDILDRLPPPSGSSRLTTALSEAVRLLAQTTNVSREVLVLSDRQQVAWELQNAAGWARFTELRDQPSVRPRTWVAELPLPSDGPRSNVSVGQLQVSHPVAVRGFPIRIRTKLASHASEETESRSLTFQVNGQSIAGQSRTVQIPTDGETSVEFEQTFSTLGKYIVRVSAEEDGLPGDDMSEAVIVVGMPNRVGELRPSLPALIIDGAPDLDPTRAESFFLSAALAATEDASPWIAARVADWQDWSANDLDDVDVVVAANVARWTDAQRKALMAFVESGGGLLFGLGDRCDPDEMAWFGTLVGVEPTESEEGGVRGPGNGERPSTIISNASLQTPWLERFRDESEGTLTEARFHQWFKLELAGSDEKAAKGGLGTVPAPLTVIELRSAAPLLVTRNVGMGRVALWTSSLDADWTTLPASQDFVPFLHEVLFWLGRAGTQRNVDVGTPLVLPIDESVDVAEYAFFAPDGEPGEPRLRETGGRRFAHWDDTHLTGVYEFGRRADGPSAGNPSEPFVVRSDRRESNLTAITPEDADKLGTEMDLNLLSVDDGWNALFEDGESQTELWHLILVGFVIMLVVEVIMTRKLVQGGHFVDDEAAE